jgi:5-methylcytosine-specific restriction endonuclease McrA
MRKIKRRGRRRKSTASLRINLANRLNKRKYSKRYLETMNYVKLRDLWSCQHPNCRKPTSVKLTIHHIQRYSDKKALREKRSNLISLCYDCHRAVTGQEKKFENKFKIIARRNEREYRKNRKTKEQILAEQKKYQVLPDGFKSYEYKSDEEITKVKKEEYFLKRLHRLIRFRTQNKNSNSYKAYGGRGITMYPEWVKDYGAFEKYINENLGDRPEGSSIDRIDNDKGYEPGNIRWATPEAQGQNRRTNVLNEELVVVILILYYKQKMKIVDILEKLNLTNRSIINAVVKGTSWKNVTVKYKSIITDPKVLAKIEEYESKL